MKFTEMLSERWQNAGSMLCVGLDPNPARFPHELVGRSTNVLLELIWELLLL